MSKSVLKNKVNCQNTEICLTITETIHKPSIDGS